MKENKAAILTFSKVLALSKFSNSQDTKSPSNPASGENQYTYVNVDIFSN